MQEVCCLRRIGQYVREGAVSRMDLPQVHSCLCPTHVGFQNTGGQPGPVGKPNAAEYSPRTNARL